MVEMLHLVRRKHAVINQELEDSLSRNSQSQGISLAKISLAKYDCHVTVAY
jgi:hypothetical protein